MHVFYYEQAPYVVCQGAGAPSGIESKIFDYALQNSPGLQIASKTCISNQTLPTFMTQIAASGSPVVALGGLFVGTTQNVGLERVAISHSQFLKIGYKQHNPWADVGTGLMTWELSSFLYFTFVVLGLVFWYSENLGLVKNKHRKDNYHHSHDILTSAYRIMLLYLGNVDRVIHSSEGKILGIAVTFTAFFLIGTQFASMIGRDGIRMQITNGFDSLAHVKVVSRQQFKSHLAEFEVFQEDEKYQQSFFSGGDLKNNDLLVAEDLYLKFRNKESCDIHQFDTFQAIPVNSWLIANSHVTQAQKIQIQQAFIKIARLDHQISIKTKILDPDVGTGYCPVSETYISYLELSANFVTLCIAYSIAIAIHILPFKGLVGYDFTETLDEKKQKYKDKHQLRSAKILSVLYSLMEKNFQNIQESIELTNTCLSYSDSTGSVMVDCFQDIETDLERKQGQLLAFQERGLEERDKGHMVKMMTKVDEDDENSDFDGKMLEEVKEMKEEGLARFRK